jgi:hypothetical protein
MLFLFGVVYRYCVREDTNPMLKQAPWPDIGFNCATPDAFESFTPHFAI